MQSCSCAGLPQAVPLPPVAMGAVSPPCPLLPSYSSSKTDDRLANRCSKFAKHITSQGPGHVMTVSDLDYHLAPGSCRF